MSNTSEKNTSQCEKCMATGSEPGYMSNDGKMDKVCESSNVEIDVGETIYGLSLKFVQFINRLLT